jgi:membrane-bound metal-dependent hydrolase YbcI (DUF457 family)
MLLWHIGASIAFVRYAFRDPFMDLRFLALGAILSDILDLPFGIILWDNHETVRLFGHSILFGAAVMIVVLVATRRGPWRKRLILLATGVLLHLALDAMWQSPGTLWWPFLGDGFTATGFASYSDYVGDLLTNPIMWAGEAAGMAYLVALWRKSELGAPHNLREFLATGVVSAPIDRT